MSVEQRLAELLAASEDPYEALDKAYLALDRGKVLRTRNIQRIPEGPKRKGGKVAYAEWAHVVGIFQTLLHLHLGQHKNNQILDVGCGAGLLAIASEPFLGDTGRYLGLDVSRRDIKFCRGHYPPPQFEFIHLDVANPNYAPRQELVRQPWPVADSAFDMITALSVWTHFSEADARFYMGEVRRALQPGGRAIISCFLLDEDYQSSLAYRSDAEGRFHTLPQNRWIFDQPCYGSSTWFHPKWVKVPEQAVAISQRGLNSLLAESGLVLTKKYSGNWKELPGVYFQDVLVLEKPMV